MPKTILALPFGLMALFGCASTPSQADTPSVGESSMVAAPTTTKGSTPSGNAGSSTYGDTSSTANPNAGGPTESAATGGPGDYSRPPAAVA